MTAVEKSEDARDASLDRLRHACALQPFYLVWSSSSTQVDDAVAEHQKLGTQFGKVTICVDIAGFDAYASIPACPAPTREDITAIEGVAESASTNAGNQHEHPPESSAPSSRQKRNRHCKNKRDRYRRLVARLVEVAAKDPGAFLAQIGNLPPSIAECEKSKALLLAALEAKAMMQFSVPAGHLASGEAIEGGCC
mmetsp:Transcript_100190/g.322901  ORF Transcript_100190/g.322901 Transcript_100190/m.322901 type:complete len:195 (+) Transcript_100190:182-766(+)